MKLLKLSSIIHHPSSINNRPGQAALIVTLVVIVGLTVAVAVISRSVTDVGVSTQEEEKARSFSAAEAGVEDALRQDLSTIAGGNFQFQVGGPETTTKYSVSQLTSFISPVDPGQVVTIDWTKGSATSASISWSDNCAQLVSTQITSAGSVTFNVSNAGDTTANISKGSNKLSRLRFVGCSVNVTIESPLGTNLSFYDVDSTGQSGQSTSRVEVIRSEPAAPGLMDFAVFSGGDIQ